MLSKTEAQALLDECYQMFLNHQGPRVYDPETGYDIQYNVDGTVFGYWDSPVHLVCTNGDYQKAKEYGDLIRDSGFVINQWIAYTQEEAYEKYSTKPDTGYSTVVPTQSDNVIVIDDKTGATTITTGTTITIDPKNEKIAVNGREFPLIPVLAIVIIVLIILR